MTLNPRSLNLMRCAAAVGLAATIGLGLESVAGADDAPNPETTPETTAPETTTPETVAPDTTTPETFAPEVNTPIVDPGFPMPVPGSISDPNSPNYDPNWCPGCGLG